MQTVATWQDEAYRDSILWKVLCLFKPLQRPVWCSGQELHLRRKLRASGAPDVMTL